MKGFILLKPETIQRNLVGKIITILEEKGLKIVALKMLLATKQQIEELYGHLNEVPHYNGIIECCLDGPVIAIVVESPPPIDSSKLITDLQGKFDLYGTIRFLFVSHPSRSVLHCSEPNEGERELKIFFNERELVDYHKLLDEWIIEKQ